MRTLRVFIENGIEITEFTLDGVTVSHRVETPAQPQEPIEPQETLEQKVERIELQRQDDTLMQLDVLATIYEELLMKGSV